MPIRAVAYASEAIRKIAADGLGQTEGKLCAIVDDAARFNRNAGVTGVLLFDGEHFLQYLEGPEDGLSVAHSRVIGASSHTGLVELQRGRGAVAGCRFGPCGGCQPNSTSLVR